MTLNDLITELQKLQPKYGTQRVNDWQLAVYGMGYVTKFGYDWYEHKHRPLEPTAPVVAAYIPEVPLEELTALKQALERLGRPEPTQ